ncbi:hypothetical protein ABZX95_46325, partial [Streptomyces sp. NPDC004232]|uniref:hypothetical protein n=1 Tax=Streptomyces sp. NPDC004232 TaxID=3154454 RepID=UPI0033BDA0A7
MIYVEDGPLFGGSLIVGWSENHMFGFGARCGGAGAQGLLMFLLAVLSGGTVVRVARSVFAAATVAVSASVIGLPLFF